MAIDGLPSALVNPPGETPGWYGKLPSLGDFSARRLPAGFIEAWDQWISSRMAASRAALGEAWVGAYLGSPVWRFVLMPGTLAGAPQCWAGVLMASIDNVGRHFPFTAAAALPAPPVTGAEIQRLWDWLASIERVAIDALEFDHDIETLEARLESCPVPSPSPPPASVALLNRPWRMAGRAHLVDGLALAFAPLWQSEARGFSLWSTTLPDHDALADDPPFLMVPALGLPDAALFIAMLRNRCEERPA